MLKKDQISVDEFKGQICYFKYEVHIVIQILL